MEPFIARLRTTTPTMVRSSFLFSIKLHQHWIGADTSFGLASGYLDLGSRECKHDWSA